MSDLVVDSQIRGWVFLPIVVITFLVGILRHYISILLASQKKIEPQQLQDSQVILRSRVLRENSRFIPRMSFLMRRQFFNNEENGYLTQKRAPVTQNVMTDPSMMTDMLKGNVTNVLPMIIIGGWINWMFSGFITTRVPFPLTLRFKPMLQRGIELMHLDASWVSSASWYFLNVFGLRSIYALVLGENNAADQARQMQDQMSGAAMAMPPDPKVAFKAEWEALEIIDHQWVLNEIENNVFVELGAYRNKTIILKHKQIAKIRHAPHIPVGCERSSLIRSKVTPPTVEYAGSLKHSIPLLWRERVSKLSKQRSAVNARVPFPLTIRYQPMLQMNIELTNLDASWVSSASWYFLNEFGLRGLYMLVLGKTKATYDALMIADYAARAEKVFPMKRIVLLDEEKFSLQIVDHQWALNKIETYVTVGRISVD